jgi:hypothetical protein
MHRTLVWKAIAPMLLIAGVTAEDSGDVAGTYVLQLTADDGEYLSTDTVTGRGDIPLTTVTFSFPFPLCSRSTL